MKRNIIALGGGGFSMEPENPALDHYILEQSFKKKPKICFLGTASGDSKDYIDRFYINFRKMDCRPSHLSLFMGHTHKIEDFILQQDIIYVGGGNTRNMLLLWREWGLDNVLKKAYYRGTVLSGLSAGAICWFEEGLTDSIPNQFNKLDCLGLLKVSYCPHFDGECERQNIYRDKIRKGEMKEGYACDDGVGLHFSNENLKAIISSRSNANAYKYNLENDVLHEKKIEPLRLIK